MARKVEFDRDVVLENAMNTFWKNGYSMTSIPNLVEATKLNPGSIYAAFDSKEGLFLETLDFYGQRSIKQLQEIIQKAETPLTGIKNFLVEIIRKRTKNERGCLVLNTLLEMSSHNPTVQTHTNKQLKAVEAELLKTLENAQALGEIPSSANPKTLAKYLMVNIWGLRVMAKTKTSKQQAEALIEQIFLSLKA